MIDESFCRHILVDLQLGREVKNADVEKAIEFLLDLEDTAKDCLIEELKDENYYLENENDQLKEALSNIEDLSKEAQELNEIDEMRKTLKKIQSIAE